MENNKEKTYKFTGGLRVGSMTRTWPNGEIEISSDTLVLRDKMFKKEYKFSKDEILRINIKKSLPIIGCGVQITHTNGSYKSVIIFWYDCFRLKKMITVLRGLDWLGESDQ